MSNAQRCVIARRTNEGRRVVAGIACVLALTVITPRVEAQSSSTGPSFDIYGFVMADMIFEFGQSDPNWFDALRPSKLPSSDDQYGKKKAHVRVAGPLHRKPRRFDRPQQTRQRVAATMITHIILNTPKKHKRRHKQQETSVGT